MVRLLKALELSVSIAILVMHTKVSTVACAPIWVFHDDRALKDIHESPTVHVTFNDSVEQHLSFHNN